MMEPETCYNLFGIECGKGWKKLYQPIIDWIDKYNEENPSDNPIEITQIKEKYGGLRFYVNWGTRELYDMIDKAEDESYNTCELCGCHIDEPIVKHHWIYPICQKCFNENYEE